MESEKSSELYGGVGLQLRVCSADAFVRSETKLTPPQNKIMTCFSKSGAAPEKLCSNRETGALLNRLPFRMDTSHYRTKLLVFFIIFAVSTFLFWSILRSLAPVKEVFDTPSGTTTNKSNGDVKSWCPLTENPPNFNDGLDLSSKFEEPGAIELQVERLSEAVRVATVSYDDNGNVGEDERWNVFFHFHDVLNNLFPLLSVYPISLDRE